MYADTGGHGVYIYRIYDDYRSSSANAVASHSPVVARTCLLKSPPVQEGGRSSASLPNGHLSPS